MSIAENVAREEDMQAERTMLRAIAPRPQPRAFDLSPQSFEQALTFSQYLADSEMVPKQFRGKPGDCLVAMQWGNEVNLKPLQALQSIAVINGKPGIYGDAGKAILLSHGCIIEEDDMAVVERNGFARCRITRPGRPPVERTFSVHDAQRAGLWEKDGPWKTYPSRQMAWRAFWFAARDSAADLLRGLAGVEELADVPEKHMGAAEVVTPAIAQAPAIWPADKFAEQLARWTKAIQAGLKTHDDIVALAKSKGELTVEQVDAIRTVVGPKPDPKAVDTEPQGDQQ